MFDLHTLFSHAAVDLLEEVEESFKMINYKNHTDDLFQLSMLDLTQLGSKKDYATKILHVYKNHIHIALSMQGIHLIHDTHIKLSDLANILFNVCLLGTAPLVDIYASGITPSDVDDPLHFVVDILKQLTKFPEEILLTYIESINEEIVLYLQHHEPNMNVLSSISNHSEHRFKESPLLKTGIVVDTIRTMESFGYDLDLFIKTHADLINQLTEIEDIAREIILMVLGSSIDNEHVNLKCYEIAEHILSTRTNDLLRVNSLINKYFNK
jgi:hypothetical protein